MASRILAGRGRDALVCGLQWHPLVERQRTKEILIYAANADADKVLVLEKDGIAAVGLCQPLEDDDVINVNGNDAAKPKRVYSAAAVAASQLGNANAVIALTMPDKARAAVIVINGGVPTVDDIKPIEAAQELVKGYVNGLTDGLQYPLYTNDLGSFGEGQVVDLFEAWEAAGKTAELVGKPVNYVALGIVVVVVVVSVASIFGWRAHVKKVKLAKAAAEAAAADPRPQYEALLESQMSKLGWSGPQVNQILNQLDRQTLYVAGWTLHQVSCTTESDACVSEWTREGGLSEQLIVARAKLGETPLQDSTKSRIFMSFKPAAEPSGVTSLTQIPTIKDWSDSSTNLMQVWENAGIQLAVGAGGFNLWPAMPNIAKDAIPTSVGVRSVGTIFLAPEDVTREAMATEPSNYYWRELVMTVGETVEEPLKLELKGMIYAR